MGVGEGDARMRIDDWTKESVMAIQNEQIRMLRGRNGQGIVGMDSRVAGGELRKGVRNKPTLRNQVKNWNAVTVLTCFRT